MNALPALEQLEHVVQDEHLALICGDWKSVRSCADRKQGLSDTLAVEGLAGFQMDRVQKLRQALIYNAELATTLGRQVGAILSHRQPAPTYDGGGRVNRRPPTVVSLRG